MVKAIEELETPLQNVQMKHADIVAKVECFVFVKLVRGHMILVRIEARNVIVDSVVGVGGLYRRSIYYVDLHTIREICLDREAWNAHVTCRMKSALVYLSFDGAKQGIRRTDPPCVDRGRRDPTET